LENDSVDYVSADELKNSDLEGPIAGIDCADPSDFESHYANAAKVSETSEAQKRIYGLLSALCSFHFKPSDKVEPFPYKFAMGGKRSMQGSDVDQAQVDALHSVLCRFRNLALRTRVADLIWTRDRSKSDCARVAVDGYVELAKAVLNGTATDKFERDPALGMTTQNYLTRAAAIARQTGWSREENDPLRSAVMEAVALAKSKDPMAVVRFGNLAADLRLEGLPNALSDLENLATDSANKGEFHEAESLQRLAVRLARLARNNEAAQSATLKLTSMLEQKADASDHTLLKTHALQQAIDSLHGLKGVRDLRQRLHEKLTAAQLHMYEEMGQIEHSIDLTDEVERILGVLKDSDLVDCLRALAITELPKAPAALKEQARTTIQEFPLSSLFASSILDAKGRTVARTAGAIDDDDQSLVYQIIKQEEIRVGVAVAGAIDPIRGMITSRFTVNEDVIEKICSMSPFVPSGSELAFARGIQAFLAGDDLVAAMLLVPYLEAGLRAMVGVAGRSDTKIAIGGIEETIGLSAMLSQHRDVLEKVFTEALVFAIEIIFVHELGPKVRHNLCHGLARDGHFYSEWYVYASKLIYSLVMLPLLNREHWPAIKAAIVSETSLAHTEERPRQELAHSGA
jgi:hypothetical protein